MLSSISCLTGTKMSFKLGMNLSQHNARTFLCNTPQLKLTILVTAHSYLHFFDRFLSLSWSFFSFKYLYSMVSDTPIALKFYLTPDQLYQGSHNSYIIIFTLEECMNFTDNFFGIWMNIIPPFTNQTHRYDDAHKKKKKNEKPTKSNTAWKNCSLRLAALTAEITENLKDKPLPVCLSLWSGHFWTQ